MANDWFYTQNDQPVGPISAQVLKQLADTGSVTADSLVWKSGMAQWKLAAAVKGLFESAPLVSTSPPPLTQPVDESSQSAPAEAFPASITTRSTVGRGRTHRRKMNPVLIAVGGTGALAVVVAIVAYFGFGGRENGKSDNQEQNRNVASTDDGSQSEVKKVPKDSPPVKKQPANEPPASRPSLADAESYFIRGEKAVKAGDLEAAVADYKEAVRLEPTDGTYQYSLFDSWHRMSDFDRATVYYGDSIRTAAGEAKALFLFYRAQAWAEKEEWLNALADYDEAIRTYPDHRHWYIKRHLMWNGKNDKTPNVLPGGYGDYANDYGRAIADYTRFIDQVAKSPLAYSYRSWAWARKGEYQKAVADVTEAIRLEPKFDHHHSSRARLYEKQGEFARALTDYEQATVLYPQSSSNHHDLAWFLATCPDNGIRNGARAIAVAEKAISLFKTPDSPHLASQNLEVLAAAYAELADFDKAAQKQSEAISWATQAELELEPLKERLAAYQQNKPWREGPDVVATRSTPTDPQDSTASTGKPATTTKPTDGNAPSPSSPTTPTAGFQTIWKGDGGKFIEVQSRQNGRTMRLTFQAHNFNHKTNAGLKYSVQGLDAATKQIITQIKKNRNAVENRSRRKDDSSGAIVVRTVELQVR